MRTLKQLQEDMLTKKKAIKESRSHTIIANKLKLMDFLKRGGITNKEKPELDKAHKAIDDEIHSKFGKRPEEMKESKMAELDDAIRSKFTDKHDVQIEGNPSIETRKNWNGKEEAETKNVLHQVTYSNIPGGRRFATYVHHPLGDHTNIKMGLPKRGGGDILTRT